MSKLVILKLGVGSFASGFPVILQVGDDGTQPSTEITGKLPPNSELPETYQQWQEAYRGLGLRSRLSAPSAQTKNVSLFQDCEQAAQHLHDRLNGWLRAESFRPIRETWLEKLQPSDTIRIIIQTENNQLQKLPWHLWDLLERYPNAEIALSAPAYDRVSHFSNPTGCVSVLAVLGNSKGIDTQADRAMLEKLPDAQVMLLVEPSRQELTDRLWEQPWDILFFAGHSSSQENGETGQLYINQTDSLSLNQLKFALKKALARRLKLAIFNSCDGLGLARELADLHIPQVIVMREPVPDQVAQAFLRYFLQSFSAGDSLYTAVRHARERLQALEDQFPCATWLPVIYQNPAELPPTWQGMTGKREKAKVRGRKTTANPVHSLSPGSPPPHSPSSPLPLHRTIVLSIVVTAFVTGVRYLNLLQPVELQAFDRLMQLRPDEGTDSRLLVVTIDDSDLQTQPGGRSSLSDTTLNQLLSRLDQYQPRVIGLDIYRDYPVEAGQKSLINRMKHDSRLVAVCKVNDPESHVKGIAPPPEIPNDQLGFSDFLEDEDGVLRRQLLFMDLPPDSPCPAPTAFSVQLAGRFLAKNNIQPNVTSDGNLQFGQTILDAIPADAGGYQEIDAWGSQIILNYRAGRRPIEQVSLKQVLAGQIQPTTVKDRIVLIGVTARSYGDYWSTPFGSAPADRMSGVMVQAEMTSQILGAVLNNRPPIWFWPQIGEIAWIAFWSLTSGLFCWWLYVRNKSFGSILAQVTLFLVLGSGVLVTVCFGFLIQGGWIPLSPPLLATAGTVGAIALYRTFQTRRAHHSVLHQE